jgi:alpha-L-fucosidase 2
MLLQSHAETPLTPPHSDSAELSATSAHIIRLLPALPKAWPTGSFRGLRACGGAEIDLQWSQGKATEATLRSGIRRVHRLAIPPGQHIESVLRNGKRVDAKLSTDGMLFLEAEPGTTHVVRFS